MKYLYFLCLSVFIMFASACSNAGKKDVAAESPAESPSAKDSIEALNSMSRSEWLAIGDRSKQMDIYDAFTPEKRLDFWMEKVDEVLTLPWSKEEAAHIEALKALLQRNAAVFQDNYSDEVKKAFDEDLKQWTDKAIKDFKWDSKILSAIAASPYPMLDTKGNVKLPDGACSKQ